jgi:hypothetical protein
LDKYRDLNGYGDGYSYQICHRNSTEHTNVCRSNDNDHDVHSSYDFNLHDSDDIDLNDNLNLHDHDDILFVSLNYYLRRRLICSSCAEEGCRPS